jgi:peptide-methionine (R)-S-oxide reductase
MKIFWLVSLAVGLSPMASCQHAAPAMKTESYPITRSEAEWREILTPEQFRILRQKGTEYPGTGKYDKHFATGTYVCAGCGTPLFASESKFDAHCGWPSFDAQLPDANVTEKPDNSHGMVRTEILCKKCGGHLGHVFDDGPTATGLRYCVNSASLQFEEPKK